MVSELDAAIGRLTARLEREGILDNTLIWFMSDNGGLNATAVPPALQWNHALFHSHIDNGL